MKNKAAVIEKNCPQEFLAIQLQELEAEAQKLFEVLDYASLCIRQLEARLFELKANFPFKLKIKMNHSTLLKPPLPRHTEGSVGTVHGYLFSEAWFLAWGKDSSSNSFRLSLIMEEVEFIRFDWGECIEQTKEFSSQVKFQRPLIETDLATRLEYSEHLTLFIEAFKNYLRDYRTHLTQNFLSCFKSHKA